MGSLNIMWEYVNVDKTRIGLYHIKMVMTGGWFMKLLFYPHIQTWRVETNQNRLLTIPCSGFLDIFGGFGGKTLGDVGQLEHRTFDENVWKQIAEDYCHFPR